MFKKLFCKHDYKLNTWWNPKVPQGMIIPESYLCNWKCKKCNHTRKNLPNKLY